MSLSLTYSLTDDSGDEAPLAQDGRALTAGVLKTLASKLDDLNTCNELIGKHGAALQRSLSELEDPRGATDGTDRLKAVNERATLFRITSNAAINVSLASGWTRAGPMLAPLLGPVIGIASDVWDRQRRVTSPC